MALEDDRRGHGLGRAVSSPALTTGFRGTSASKLDNGGGGLPAGQGLSRTIATPGMDRSISSPGGTSAGFRGTPASSKVDSTAFSEPFDGTILPSLSCTMSQRSVRWNRNVAGRWPSVHKAHYNTIPYQPEMRIRSLICNWPGHFCRESLIMVPAGSEPVVPPYRMTVCCDLRPLRDELRTKRAYLVAYDAERLRRRGLGMGIDPLEASRSWVARYCVCSEVVPLKRLYGEVQITLTPPDFSEGTALALIRVVVVADPSDLKDWHAAGDPVVVQVEPRLGREDRKGLQKLQCDLEESQRAAESSQVQLEAVKGELGTVSEARIQLRAEARQWKFEAEAKDHTISELEAALQQACSELQASQAAAGQARTAAKLQTVLDRSRQQQLKVSEESATELQASLLQSRRELEASQDDTREIQRALKDSRGAKSKAQAALRMHQTMSKAQRHQLWERSQLLDEAQLEARLAREEAHAANEAQCEMRAALDHARLDADVWEEAASSAQTELDKLKEELSQLRRRRSAGSLSPQQLRRERGGRDPSSVVSPPATPTTPLRSQRISTASGNSGPPAPIPEVPDDGPKQGNSADGAGAVAGATGSGGGGGAAKGTAATTPSTGAAVIQASRSGTPSTQAAAGAVAGAAGGGGGGAAKGPAATTPSTGAAAVQASRGGVPSTGAASEGGGRVSGTPAGGGKSGG